MRSLARMTRVACECDAGWSGSTCSVARLKPLNLEHGYHNASAASWGGRAIVDPNDGNLWSLFVAQFSNRCPLKMWIDNSQVIRAISTTGPAGPYKYAEKVYPEFHHNPTVVGPTKDGHYLIFMTGETNASAVKDCTHGVPDDPGGSWKDFGHVAGKIDMGWSKSMHGPWETRAWEKLQRLGLLCHQSFCIIA